MPETKTLDINGRKVTFNTGLYINGEFVNAKSGRVFPSEDPRTGKIVAEVQEGDAEDVDVAVEAARATMENPEWTGLNPAERGKFMNKLADLMEEHTEDILAIEMLDTGKTRKQALSIDLPGSVGTLRYYAGFADKVNGLASNNIPGAFAYTRREPVGVCGQIIPWNFPLLMFTWKIAPAFCMGNAVVIKSAETTPLTALYMCGLIQKAGWPKGTVNLVSGYGKTVGAAIAHHMDIDKVAFTGSTATGRSILKAAADSNLKKVTLELGGKSPNIIFDDADISKAVDWSLFGINMNYVDSAKPGSGIPTCHAGTRLFVHENVYDEFVKEFAKGMQKLRVGDNFDENTDQGPQNSKIQYDKILGYLDTGKKEGAKVEIGGNAYKHQSGQGYFIEPTIFSNVTPDMKIQQEEIFGPVVTITKFRDEAEVIKLANKTNYGLASGIHTRDYERAMRVTAALKAGTAWVNMFNFVHWSIPFGGYKQSGLGRECGEIALENYTETKAVFYSMGTPAPK